MKNIEFRIYDKQEKKFLIKGEKVKRGDIKNLLCEIIDFDDFSIQIDNPDYDRYKLLQYTGIKDKNGIKIFEGDIVKWIDSDRNTRINDVFFEDGAFRICNSFFEISEYEELEVLGNVYEHSKLLKTDRLIFGE